MLLFFILTFYFELPHIWELTSNEMETSLIKTIGVNMEERMF